MELGVNGRLPHAAAVRLEQPTHHVSHRFGVARGEPSDHHLVVHVALVCLCALVRPVVGEAGGGRRGTPADHRRETLRYRVRAARALRRHRVGPLRVEQLGAVLHSQRRLELAGLHL